METKYFLHGRHHVWVFVRICKSELSSNSSNFTDICEHDTWNAFWLLIQTVFPLNFHRLLTSLLIIAMSDINKMETTA